MGKTPFTLSPNQIKQLPKKPFAFIKATITNMHSHSKGVGLIRSVDGNMLVGPNALEVFDREDYHNGQASYGSHCGCTTRGTTKNLKKVM